MRVASCHAVKQWHTTGVPLYTVCNVWVTVLYKYLLHIGLATGDNANKRIDPQLANSQRIILATYLANSNPFRSQRLLLQVFVLLRMLVPVLMLSN